LNWWKNRQLKAFALFKPNAEVETASLAERLRWSAAFTPQKVRLE
jgi:hypothetical protein